MPMIGCRAHHPVKNDEQRACTECREKRCRTSNGATENGGNNDHDHNIEPCHPPQHSTIGETCQQDSKAKYHERAPRYVAEFEVDALDVNAQERLEEFAHLGFDRHVDVTFWRHALCEDDAHALHFTSQ